jgi:hypothetical protein
MNSIRLFPRLMAAFAAVILAIMQPVAAQEKFDVGRVNITFPSPGWKRIKLEDAGVPYAGFHIMGTYPAETQLFVNATPDKKVLSIMRIRASKGGIMIGNFVYSPKCEASDANHAEGNSGPGRSFAQCLVVYPLFSTSSLLKYLEIENETKFKSFAGDVPEKGMRLISAYYASANGTFISIEILLAPQFVGLRGNSTQDDPHLLWGRELMDAVKGSVRSFSGDMKFPAMEFKVEQLG